MRLGGRRRSSNVEDRRGISGGAGAGLGIGGIILVALFTWLSGGDLTSVISNVGGQLQQSNVVGQEYTPTAHEEELANFASIILAGTEDVWTEEFKKIGKTYTPPKMVIFKDNVQSGCGYASSQTGPFYCSADQTVYIDLGFFDQMEKEMQAGGDFAYAYVIAHEVGHHVQNLLGILSQVHQRQQQLSEVESNRLNVMLELRADYLAGVWANHDNERYNSLEDGDIEEGLNAASKIGDDYLQKQAQGYAVPDTFNHGTSAQRNRWLKKGYTYGTLEDGDTFSVGYNNL